MEALFLLYLCLRPQGLNNMQTWRPLIIGTSVVVLLGVITYVVLRTDSAALPEPMALVLLGTGLFACAQARRHLLKKI